MSNFEIIRVVIALLSFLLCFAICYSKSFKNKYRVSARFLTRCAIFAAISTLLYVIPTLQINLPIFPSFLSLHFDEAPIFIASFAYGPIYGIFITIIKTLIKLPMTSTLGVGELTDLFYTIIFILPASVLYKKRRNFKNVIIGLSISTIIQLVVSSFFTTFIILNFYMSIIGLSEETILHMCQIANPNITDLSWPFLFMIALPFNLMKDICVISITLLLYKRLSSFINKIYK